jgi:hypothetical protein
MDPYVAFRAGIVGDLDARAAYNRWVKNGGFTVQVRVRKFTKTWLKGTRRINVRKIEADKVRGSDVYNSKVKVSIPFAALEVD